MELQSCKWRQVKPFELGFESAHTNGQNTLKEYRDEQIFFEF